MDSSNTKVQVESKLGLLADLNLDSSASRSPSLIETNTKSSDWLLYALGSILGDPYQSGDIYVLIIYPGPYPIFAVLYGDGLVFMTLAQLSSNSLTLDSCFHKRYSSPGSPNSSSYHTHTASQSSPPPPLLYSQGLTKV